MNKLLFQLILYVADLVEVVNECSVNIHAFANNTQLYQLCFRDKNGSNCRAT